MLSACVTIHNVAPRVGKPAELLLAQACDPSFLRDLDLGILGSCLPELAMLRRKPTRIELRGEDIEEYEKVKKLWAKDPKKDQEAAKAQSFLGNDDSPMPLNDPKRILRIHERIGYKPDTVPSDGTVTFLS